MLEGLAGARLRRRQLDLAPEALAGERHVRPPGDREPDRGPRLGIEAQAEPGRVARGPEDPGGILDEGERAERAESAGAEGRPSAVMEDRAGSSSTSTRGTWTIPRQRGHFIRRPRQKIWRAPGLTRSPGSAARCDGQFASCRQTSRPSLP